MGGRPKFSWQLFIISLELVLKNFTWCAFTGPAGQAVPCEIRGNYSTGWTVHWTPHHLGVHTIDVKYGRSTVAGSPFACKVFDLSKVVILHDPHRDQLSDDADNVVFYGTTCRATLVKFRTRKTDARNSRPELAAAVRIARPKNCASPELNPLDCYI